MSTGGRATVAVLAVATIVLTAVLVMDLGWNHDSDHMNARSNDYMAMMDAMGRMDSDDMLGRMEGILGQERYQAMVTHMVEHRQGTATTPGSGIDGMMHMMMDGMMNQMPADRNDMMPISR